MANRATKLTYTLAVKDHQGGDDAQKVITFNIPCISIDRGRRVDTEELDAALDYLRQELVKGALYGDVIAS